MLYNNTAFDNGDKNDIIIMIEQGGNEGTISRNNAANKIAGHRTGNYEDYPVPGIYDHNWNGYEMNTDIKEMLVDPENHDFRPIAGSALIDSGVDVQAVTDGYIGAAPDLGAYEYGGDYWIPGITWDVDSIFGETFIEVIELNVGENPNRIPTGFHLYPAFPNPFNPITTLRYDLLENSFVTIIIYDILGKEVKTLINQTQNGGYKSILWDGTNDHGHSMSTGIYLYRIQAGNFTRTKKMVLLK